MNIVSKLREQLLAEEKHPDAPTVADESGLMEEMAGGKVVLPADIANKANVATELSAEAAVLERFKDHFVSVDGAKTLVFRETRDPETGHPDLQRMSTRDFKDLYANETVVTATGTRPAAAVWLTHRQRRTYSGGLKLIPNGSAPPDVYNLWRGFGCKPSSAAAAEAVRPALKHLKYIVCGGDQVAYRYLLRWWAYTVQQPATQAEVAVVMIGGRGTGKGTLGRWFSDLFGSHGLHVQNPDHLTGRFNGHLRTTLGLFVDEAVFVGDHRGNQVLKSLITEDRIMIEAKYSQAAQARNRLKIMMATNADHAIPAGIDERRFFVVRVSDRKKQDHSYFAQLADWWQAGGNSAMLAFLQQVDLNGFNIRDVPKTRALDQQKILSLTGLDEWLYELLQSSSAMWKRQTTAAELAERFRWFCQDKGCRYEKTSPVAVSRRIHSWLEVERKREGAGTRQWVLNLPELDEARRQFEEKLGVRIDWDD